MKISGIDKDFVDIIEYLNENGYKTFASCDGVLEHHADDIVVPSSAYISFLKSPKIIDLMAQFAKDKDKFIINIANNTYKEPYYLYGNIISGNRYGVYFKNEKGEPIETVEGLFHRVASAIAASWVPALVAAACLGLGYILVQPTLVTLSMEADPAQAGLCTGLIGFAVFACGGVGSALGSGVDTVPAAGSSVAAGASLAAGVAAVWVKIRTGEKSVIVTVTVPSPATAPHRKHTS